MFRDLELSFREGLLSSFVWFLDLIVLMPRHHFVLLYYLLTCMMVVVVLKHHRLVEIQPDTPGGVGVGVGGCMEPGT